MSEDRRCCPCGQPTTGYYCANCPPPEAVCETCGAETYDTCICEAKR